MVDLASLNTLHVHAKAERIIQIDTTKQLAELVSSGAFVHQHFILGHGANVLFTKDFPGSIITNRLTGKTVREIGDSIEIELASGEDWSEIVAWTVKNNWSGLENMSGIPGSVGAAAVGNIGAYGGNQEDVFVSLLATDITTGKTIKLTKSDLQFTYRESALKHSLSGKYFVTSVTYHLSKTAHLDTSYRATRHASLLTELQRLQPDGKYTISTVSQAILNLRASKLPDIREVGTAGSFFKNPVVPISVANKIKEIIPDLQTYPAEKLLYTDAPADKDLVKIPAGMLLEYLGWRDKRIGDVGTYKNHSLLVCNFGSASGAQVYNFSESMRADVKDKFEIDLQYEIIIV